MTESEAIELCEKYGVNTIEDLYEKAITDFITLVKNHDWNIRNINENDFIYGAMDMLAKKLIEEVR